MTGERQSESLLEIIRIQNEIAASGLDFSGVMDLVVSRARQLTDANASAIEMAEGTEMVCTVASGIAVQHLGRRMPIEGSPAGTCLTTGEVLSSDNTDNDDCVDADACAAIGAGSIICVPLAHNGVPVGALEVYSAAIYGFRGKDIDTLRHLAELVVAHMSQTTDYEAEVRNSRTDPVTGLGNRLAYDDALAAEVARARRHDRGIALCLFSLGSPADGRPVGDEVLSSIAGILAAGRSSDAGFRLEDRQFALILPETDDAGATAAATRIVTRIAEIGGIEATYGIAEGGPDALLLHERALRALRAPRPAAAMPAPVAPAPS